MNAENGTAPHSTTGVRVLIADDDARVRRALRALIEADQDIVVVGEASTTDEVLTYDHALEPTVVLLDLILPEAEERLDLLRRLARERGRRVVAISMRGGLRQAAIDAGAQSFVEKGSAPDVLLGALHAAAAQPPSCSP